MLKQLRVLPEVATLVFSLFLGCCSEPSWQYFPLEALCLLSSYTYCVALAGSAVVNIDTQGWIWLGLVLCQSHTMQHEKKWLNGRLSPPPPLSISHCHFLLTHLRWEKHRNIKMLLQEIILKYTNREKKKQKWHLWLWSISVSWDCLVDRISTL